MSVIMRLEGSPHGPTRWDGQYLKDFDFEANGGVGEITMTAHPSKAKRFTDLREALDYVRRVPKCRPLRADGLPNRPLTATNWLFLTT